MRPLTAAEIAKLSPDEFAAYEKWCSDFVDTNNAHIQSEIEVLAKAGIDFDFEKYFAKYVK